VFQGSVLRCPLPDANLDIVQLAIAAATSVTVAKTVAQGQRVLVTCAKGLNRSGLIAALALGQLTTMSGSQIITHIRKYRGPLALSNPHFQAIIRCLIGEGRPRASRSRSRSADTEG
jgi:protein-tyrosine phosphatase